MAQALVQEFRPAYGQPHPIESVELVPGSKGMYEISVDGRLVYSKKETGRHISDADAIELIRSVRGG